MLSFSATTTKTGFNIDSPGWEAFIATSKKELKPVVDQIKNKLKNRGLELSSSREKRKAYCELQKRSFLRSFSKTEK